MGVLKWMGNPVVWRTDFENMPNDKTLLFYWDGGGHDAFGGAVSAMNIGVNTTEWLEPPTHWTIIQPPQQ